MLRIWQIAEAEHGRLLLSVLLAVLGVISGIIPYVAAARIISGMISGNKDWNYYLVFIVLAFAGFTLKSILYAMGLSVTGSRKQRIKLTAPSAADEGAILFRAFR